MKPYSDAYYARFAGIARLHGDSALARLHCAKVAVIGLGGVGSWAAEALARSGVGRLTLIELDEVCVSNTNRQLHAQHSTIGQSKLTVVANRLRDINPELQVAGVADFLTRKNIPSLVDASHDLVIDAIDAAHIKATLVAYCSAVKVRLVTCGASGGKRDPSRIQVADLGQTHSDPMLAKVRVHLYRHHNFAKLPGRKFRVDAVFSSEHKVYPKPDGSVCRAKQSRQSSVKLDCASGFGSSVMVTGSFGFAAAAKAVERILQSDGHRVAEL